jgi:hypothetical protein
MLFVDATFSAAARLLQISGCALFDYIMEAATGYSSFHYLHNSVDPQEYCV